MSPSPAPWRPEDQRSWEELERRAAAQAREFYVRAGAARAGSGVETKGPGQGSEAEASAPAAAEAPPVRAGEPAAAAGPGGTAPPPPAGAGTPGPRASAGGEVPLPQAKAGQTAGGASVPAPAPATGGKKLLGRFSGDQLLLAALLCLLVQEEAEPQLILAVAYVLIG